MPVRTASSGRRSKITDPTTEWAKAAVRGDFVVGDIVRHAAERHLRDLKDAQARGYYWRPELAQDVLDFFPALFTITDGGHEIVAQYVGILPDLFREGQGVVAEGSLGADGRFEASNVLAKHDENYIPKEVVEALKAQGEWRPEGVAQ